MFEEKEIFLSDIFPLANLKDYKLHCAIYNNDRYPLELLANDWEEWVEWNRSRPKGIDVYKRKYIFSLARFHHEKDVWVFGGVFQVLGIRGEIYDIQLEDIGREYIGRLKVRLKKGRNARVNLETYYKDIVVTEILKEPYNGQTFTGFEEIDLSFYELETLVENENKEWKAALGKIKGVYLITDTLNHKKYVGSAYGDGGVWARWNTYIRTGHGDTKELRDLIKREGIHFARKNFRFSLLEYRSVRVDNQEIIDREAFWKNILLSRGDYGYNKN